MAFTSAAAGDGERGGGVAQFVRGQVEVAEPGRADRRVEEAAAEVADPQGAALGRGEEELVRRAAVDMGGQFVEEEPGEGYRAALVVLGGVQVEDALLVDIRLHHVSPSRIEVHSAHGEG